MRSLPAWHLPAPEPMPELAPSSSARRRRIAGRRRRGACWNARSLPAYLAARRWFAARTRRSRACASPLRRRDCRGRARVAALRDRGRAAERRTRPISLPLAIAWEDETADALPQQLALARVRRGRRVGFLTDAFAIDALPRAVLRALRGIAVRAAAAGGAIRFLPTARLAEIEFPRRRRKSAGFRPSSRNSSLIVGDAAVLKLVRRSSPGIHPEAEMSALPDRARLRATPPALLGEVTRVDADGTPHTLVLVQGFVRNQGDGWGWTLDFLSRGSRPASLDPEAQHEDIADTLRRLRHGRRRDRPPPRPSCMRCWRRRATIRPSRRERASAADLRALVATAARSSSRRRLQRSPRSRRRAPNGSLASASARSRRCRARRRLARRAAC